MIKKYKSEVLNFYEQKKNLGNLPTNLINPTPAKIRDEFGLLLTSGCNNTDLRMVKEFFGLQLDKELFETPQRKWDIDRFRPLCTFLKKGIKTREKNIELLALLIDFHPRPFSNYWRLSNGNTNVLSELSITESGIVDEKMRDGFYDRKQRALVKKEGYLEDSNRAFKTDHWLEKDTVESSDSTSNIRFLQKEVTLEFPSGVKVRVDASDFSLIAKLVKL